MTNLGSVLRLIAVVLVAAMMSACTTNDTKPANQIEDANIIDNSHRAASMLVQQANMPADETMIAASFVDINNLDGSSSFGRIVSQQFASAFSKSGYKVIEMLLRNNVYIKRGEGEFLLSREIRNLSAQHNIQAVVVGTYAVGRKNVYVTAKVIRATDSIVLASHDFTLPLGPDTKALLR